MTPGSIVAAGILLALASVHAASARPLEAELPKAGYACWERVYDVAHLAAHPRQKVVRAQLHHRGGGWADGGAAGFYLLLGLTLRKRLGTPDDDIDYKLGAMCRAKGAGLICRNEWDAGSFRIERSGGSLLVTNGGVTLNPSNYDAEDVADNAAEVQAQPDDRAWRLERVLQTRCTL